MPATERADTRWTAGRGGQCGCLRARDAALVRLWVSQVALRRLGRLTTALWVPDGGEVSGKDGSRGQRCQG